MGEIVEFPRRREGCARWRRGQDEMSLAARPACAALAMALAALPFLRIGRDAGGRQDARSSATVLALRTARAYRLTVGG